MKQHPGNKRFRRILEDRLLEFEREEPSKQKEIACSLYFELQMTDSTPSRFLRRDSNVGKYFLLSPLEAMENVRKAFVGMVAEKGQPKTTSKQSDRESRSSHKDVVVLGEIDPNRIVDLTNDESDDEQNKKELYCPTVNSSHSQLTGEPVTQNGTPKSLESYLRPYQDMTGISRIFFQEGDLQASDILYIEDDPVDVEITKDPFRRVLMSNFADYQKNREDPSSQKEFQMKSLRDLKKQDPSVRFMKYDNNVEKYYEWDPREALGMIQQAMEERFSKRANGQKPLTDSNSGTKTTISVQNDPPAANFQNQTTFVSPQTLGAREQPSEEAPQSLDPTQPNAPTIPIASTPPQAYSTDSNQRILAVQTAATPELANGGLAAPSVKPTPSNGSGEHTIASKTTLMKPQVTSIDSSQQTNGPVLQPDASPQPAREEEVVVAAAPLNSTNKAGSGSGNSLTPLATVALSVMKERNSSIDIEEEGSTPHDKHHSQRQPYQSCCEESDDEQERMEHMCREMERGAWEG